MAKFQRGTKATAARKAPGRAARTAAPAEAAPISFAPDNAVEGGLWGEGLRGQIVGAFFEDVPTENYDNTQEEEKCRMTLQVLPLDEDGNLDESSDPNEEWLKIGFGFTASEDGESFMPKEGYSHNSYRKGGKFYHFMESFWNACKAAGLEPPDGTGPISQLVGYQCLFGRQEVAFNQRGVNTGEGEEEAGGSGRRTNPYLTVVEILATPEGAVGAVEVAPAKAAAKPASRGRGRAAAAPKAAPKAKAEADGEFDPEESAIEAIGVALERGPVKLGQMRMRAYKALMKLTKAQQNTVLDLLTDEEWLANAGEDLGFVFDPAEAEVSPAE